MSIYQLSSFDEADRLAKLTKLKDPLEALQQHIGFEIFRPQLVAVFYKEKKSSAGRKPYDVVHREDGVLPHRHLRARRRERADSDATMPEFRGQFSGDFA